MNYKQVLGETAQRVAGKFDRHDDIPLVVIGGSIGDPYGYVTSRSDIDFLVWTPNQDYISKSPAIDWQPYTFKARHGQTKDRAIDVVTDIDDKYAASILFRLFDIEQMRKAIAELTNRPVIKRDELDKYIVNFVESLLYKDEANLYAIGRNNSTQTFNAQRGKLAKETLGDINLTMLKIRDDRELSQNEPIDLRAYNDRVIDVVNAMTYVLCCARNLPRSYSSIVKKRNNVLWDMLSMDRNKINSTMSATEQIGPSFDVLRELVSETYDDAKRELPEIKEEYRVVRKIVE